MNRRAFDSRASTEVDLPNQFFRDSREPIIGTMDCELAGLV